MIATLNIRETFNTFMAFALSVLLVFQISLLQDRAAIPSALADNVEDGFVNLPNITAESPEAAAIAIKGSYSRLDDVYNGGSIDRAQAYDDLVATSLLERGMGAQAVAMLLPLKGLKVLSKAPKGGLTPIDSPVDITDFRRDDILNGHRAGVGKPGKTEFPANWDDDRTIHQVSDIATDPNATRGLGKWDSPYAIGTRDGIEIRVDFYPDFETNGQPHPRAVTISTAYPINTPANP